MGSKFLERNKKKTLLALLLLFLRWRRGVGPLLVMVMLLMLVFIAPPNMMGLIISGLERLPMGHGAAAALAQLTEHGHKRGFADLLAALKAARHDSRPGWLLFAPGIPGGDSLTMVRGNEADLVGRGSMADKFKSSGQTISGVLSREDAKNGPQGVPFSEEEAEERDRGFAQSAFAGGMERGVGAGKVSATGAFLAGQGPYSTPGTITGNGPRPARGDNITTALNSAKVPPVDTKKVAADFGKLSKRALAQMPQGRAGAGSRNAMKQRRLALEQLAHGRALAHIARDPNCAASNGCPTEAAATYMHAAFDNVDVGGAASSGVLAGAPSAVAGAAGAPRMPNDTDLAALQAEATKIEADAKACQDAADLYKPQEGKRSQCINKLSEEMHTMDCGGGGCSSSKASACKAKGHQMECECCGLDTAMRAHYNACPLMQQDGPYHQQDCKTDCASCGGVSSCP